MCTAITFRTDQHYFGRNLDLEYHYDEAVTVTPRNLPLHFREVPSLSTHYAMIGMATTVNGYPLYYDATNEYGLSMAGLNFKDNAVYYPKADAYDNIAPFEFIPWILGQCKTVSEAEDAICRMNLAKIPFSDDYPLTPLHWLIADATNCITVEPLKEGLRVWHNPVGLLTNNPPFAFHMHHLAHYTNLHCSDTAMLFADTIPVHPYSHGLGAVGLPGDLSSASRFIRAAFTKFNSICEPDEESSVNQFFHILRSVAQQNGCCRTKHGLERTIYSSCCNTDTGTYYYTTYENSQLTAVRMHNCNLGGNTLEIFPLKRNNSIHFEN